MIMTMDGGLGEYLWFILIRLVKYFKMSSSGFARVPSTF